MEFEDLYETEAEQQYEDELELKEERISYWEQYGCVMGKDGIRCEFVYPGVRL